MARAEKTVPKGYTDIVVKPAMEEQRNVRFIQRFFSCSLSCQEYNDYDPNSVQLQSIGFVPARLHIM